MNNTTTPAAERRFFRAYSDLEPQIRDLTRMASIAQRYVMEHVQPIPGDTEERRHETEMVQFTVFHVFDMAKDLETAYDADFQSEEAAR
jgi:hypothetical protein